MGVGRPEVPDKAGSFPVSCLGRGVAWDTLGLPPPPLPQGVSLHPEGLLVTKSQH